jgi:hypothetical protein
LKTSKFPSQEYLNECFSYNPLSGFLKWKERPLRHFKNDREFKRWNTRYAGKYAGNKHKQGYIQILLDSISFKSHRIIWALVYGYWPDYEIDHKNLRTSDNTLENLREATHGQNMTNSNAYKSNKLGVKGVYKFGNRFRAMLSRNHLGLFDTIEEAKAAYDKAALDKYGEFARS